MTGRGENPRMGLVAEVLHGENPPLVARVVRLLLAPLGWLHQVGLELYLMPFRLGWRKRFRALRPNGAPVPVISIGNLTSGGTGKTPMTQLIVGRLVASCYRIVVLSRGHGGSGSTSTPRVVSDGTQILLGPAEAGDEPSLLARSLPGTPILIGRDRRRSARLALEKFAPDAIVLDDALQYWQLHRDLDIILLDARRPFDNGHLLPRGLLREPPSHLARAGSVVLTRADAVTPAALADLRERVAALAPKASVFTATHAPVGWVRRGDTNTLPLDAFRGSRALVFSAIADNAAFARSVSALGIDIVETLFFDDHHAYGGANIDEIIKLAGKSCAAVVLTTEKDLVKLARAWPDDTPELYALRIGMAVADAAGFLGEICRFLPDH